ncbi:hypothetical protein [Bacillus cereus group sp. BfR-BA-01380]|uniref:hypothetical protein n=1 Tax=Bacillus cereus group sp. BfR-BA-01380 TaxID=2920324 RepID=UPI001F5A08B2|nr:hypothetical protein [Bacillus cereus group sp. BfR-BA-01380]
MLNYFKCPLPFPVEFPPPPPPAYGFIFTEEAQTLADGTNTVIFPSSGPLNKTVNADNGLLINETGVYQIDYTVTFNIPFSIIPPDLVDFTGVLTSTAGAISSQIPGSFSRVADSTVEAIPGTSGSGFTGRFADTLTGSVLFKVTTSGTLIGVDVIWNKLDLDAAQVQFASLRAVQVV